MVLGNALHQNRSLRISWLHRNASATPGGEKCRGDLALGPIRGPSYNTAARGAIVIRISLNWLRQVSLREVRKRVPAKRGQKGTQSSFDMQALLACARGNCSAWHARLPLPPLLMFDRISHICDAGDLFGKGRSRRSSRSIPTFCSSKATSRTIRSCGMPWVGRDVADGWLFLGLAWRYRQRPGAGCR